MYIERFQLKGFKSFGGTHDFTLSSGFTAIVGPNGSGKSNLLDALRWSLGDSNAGRLRISRQSDLLFQGSVSVPSSKEAEVSMYLRDDAKSCTIKRKVSLPDGATSVFVDGAKKTLTELDLIKRDWKLEGDRFAFIGQGEVTEVINQTPAARRMKLETLFGIDLYRKNRQEVSARLDIVRAEHEKLRNLMAELSMRRDEIAPVVKKAAQLREILDNIEEERKLLYWLRYAKVEENIKMLDEKMAQFYTEHKGVVFFKNAWDKMNLTLETELAKSAQIRQQQTWELEQNKNRYDSLIKSGYSSAAMLRTSNSRLLQNTEDLREAKDKLNLLLKEQEFSLNESTEIKEKIDESEKALREVEKKWQEYNDRLEAEKETREKWNAEKGQLEAELQKIKAKLSFLGKDLLEIRDKKEKQEDPSNNFDIEINDTEKLRDKLLMEQELLAKKHSELYANVQNLAGDLQRAKREASQAKSKYNEISESIQDNLYPRPVLHLLSAVKLNRLDAAPRAVIDVFTSDLKLSTALEGYLGAKQFQLLVENIEEAGRCIEQLKLNSAGRATFLPLERCRPRFPNKSFPLPSKGIIGWGIDLIQIENHWLPAIQQIMGDLLIVENYAVGQELVRKGFRDPIVTMEGDVFQPGGTVSGGKSQKTGKVLEMKAQLSKLEKEAEISEINAKKLVKLFEQAEKEEIKLAEEKEDYVKDIRDLDGQIAVLIDRKESFKKEQKRMQGERERIIDSIREESSKWQKTLVAMDELEEKWNKETDIEDDLQIIEEREKLRAEVAVYAEKMSSQLAIMERISNEVSSEKRKISNLEIENSELDETCIESRANLSRVGKSCLEIHKRRQELTLEMENLVTGYSLFEKRHQYVKRRGTLAEMALKKVSEQLTQTESKKSELEREFAVLKDTWEEQYPYPGKEALPDDVDIEELRRKIREEDRKIKVFGEVDMGVLSEDQNLRDRISFLGENLDDVTSSAAELEKLISDADRQAHDIFINALDEVGKRFCFLFQRLFGGGEAYLKMTDGETIWDTGVDVIARPPGKHPQSIKQLSGGEQSLAAISMLFASMEVADCPLAVLDEVDAALDEVNLRRFAEIAKEYAKNRQILAITHRRATMERADVLYGVTLAEPSLSQIIGVKAEDFA
ncbi:MAG: chromosome segregation protein SMC [Synergistaceae bacterium]